MVKNTKTVPSIWIVIVNYHSQDLICKCIESLKKHIKLGFSVVVVDNSVTTDTARISELHEDVVIISANENNGFAAGCNLGIKHSQKHAADFILLLNPDTYTEQDFISPMIDAFNGKPKLGMVGPTIYFAEPKHKIWMAGTKLNWWTGGPQHIYDDRLLRNNEIVNVPFISGCAMLLRACAIDEIGLMDEKYFLYFEDADYCQAMLNSGWDIAYVPQAQVIHAASSTTGYQSENYIYYFSRNRIWFLQSWAPRAAFIYYMLFITLIKLPGSFIVFTLVRRKPKLTRAFLRGFLAGLRNPNESVQEKTRNA